MQRHLITELSIQLGVASSRLNRDNIHVVDVRHGLTWRARARVVPEATRLITCRSYSPARPKESKEARSGADKECGGKAMITLLLPCYASAGQRRSL